MVALTRLHHVRTRGKAECDDVWVDFKHTTRNFCF